MPPTSSHTRPTGLAVWLIIAGAVGWWAAFRLTVDKLQLLEDPGSKAGCDFSVLVQCGANLMSWQGSVFGFANPIIGLACWVAPIVVGVAILAGARFARWFWLLFWVGFAFAISFVGWLIYQSIFQLGTLCPWCMTTWAVTIPSFFAVTVHVLRNGAVPISDRARRAAARVMAWVPLLTLLSFAVVILLAQVRLNAIPNVLSTIFG